MTCAEFLERYTDFRDGLITAPRELRRLPTVRHRRAARRACVAGRGDNRALTRLQTAARRTAGARAPRGPGGTGECRRSGGVGPRGGTRDAGSGRRPAPRGPTPPL